MEIKVDALTIKQVIEAIKTLPVQCNFDTADRWVGIVMLLESLLQNTGQQEVKEDGK